MESNPQIPRLLAAQYGQEAVQIIRQGAYRAPSGRLVNVADLIEHAVQGTVSYPPDQPLPQTHVGPHQTRIEVANETTLAAVPRLRASGCDCEATPAVTRRVARTLPGARPETCRPLRP